MSTSWQRYPSEDLVLAELPAPIHRLITYLQAAPAPPPARLDVLTTPALADELKFFAWARYWGARDKW